MGTEMESMNSNVPTINPHAGKQLIEPLQQAVANLVGTSLSTREIKSCAVNAIA